MFLYEIKLNWVSLGAYLIMNFFEMGLSFLEGLALILSPCILPVLPLLLSSSVAGGKRKSIGMVLGFVLSFTLFALFSRKLILLLGIDLAIFKNASLILLGCFALILFSERLSEKFSQYTQKLSVWGQGSVAQHGNKSGYLSGMYLGFLIGLVWTPCAGPILAAALVQIIRQENDLQAFFIVSSFAFGAGVPMFILTLLGNQVMTKIKGLNQYTSIIRKAMGVLMLVAVVVMWMGWDTTLYSSPASIEKNTNSKAGNEKKRDEVIDGVEAYPAPDFSGIEAWLNTNEKKLKMPDLKGKVVLIDFWTYSCINCIRTLPYITSWDRKYRSKGLVIVGVHAPEFEFEKKIENVKSAIKKHSIQYPVAIDNHLDTWTNFKNRYWPAHYLINKQGNVVYTHFGEGHYEITEKNIRFLLGIRDADEASNEKTESVTDEDDILSFMETQTPETYLGFARARNFMNANASEEELTDTSSGNFKSSPKLKLHQWTLGGRWSVKKENLVSGSNTSYLKLHFQSKKVFLVMGSKHQEKKVKLKLDGKELGTFSGKDVKQGGIFVKEHTLYEVVKSDKTQEGVLTIEAPEGVELYAFTFGG